MEWLDFLPVLVLAPGLYPEVILALIPSLLSNSGNDISVIEAGCLGIESNYLLFISAAADFNLDKISSALIIGYSNIISEPSFKSAVTNGSSSL